MSCSRPPLLMINLAQTVKRNEKILNTAILYDIIQVESICLSKHKAIQRLVSFIAFHHLPSLSLLFSSFGVG